MRRISIFIIILALSASAPVYAVQVHSTHCAPGSICPWQKAAVHADAGRVGMNSPAGSIRCCQYKAVRTRDRAMVPVSSPPVFKQAPAFVGGLDLPDRSIPAGAPHILHMVSKAIPIYLKTLTLLC